MAKLPDTIKGKIVYYGHDSLRQLSKTREPLKLAWRLVETKEQEKERERVEKEKAKMLVNSRSFEKADLSIFIGVCLLLKTMQCSL